jgi:uncharacterized protein (TIGR01777 family)
MRVFITGGTGFVGNTLTNMLIEHGYGVTVLTRAITKDRGLPQGMSFLEGDPTQEGLWQESVGDHEIVINLAGASIFRRWTHSNKRAIRYSRILTTQNLVKALSTRKGKETLLLSTSAVGYYGFRADKEVDESSPPADDFLASLTHEWEDSALKAEKLGVRVLLCRFGIVLGTKDGALKRMLPLFKWYLGSPLGNGEQWFSWIHQQDLANIYLFLINQKDISGPINFTAPHPVRNKEMTKILGEVLKRPTFMPHVPGFMLKLFLGEFASTLLEGQKVLPKRLLDMGFHFKFSNIHDALQDLLGE